MRHNVIALHTIGDDKSDSLGVQNALFQRIDLNLCGSRGTEYKAKLIYKYKVEKSFLENINVFPH